MMSNLVKRSIKATLQTFGITPGLSRRLGGAHILMLHGVGTDFLPADDFRNLLIWLKKKFDVVSLASVVDRLSTTGQRIPHCFAITFDDGLRNQYTDAYPILQELDIPATFFVCPGLIDEGKRIWTYEAGFRLRYLKEKSANGWQSLEPFGFHSGDALEWMKTLPLQERNDVERWLESETTGYVMSEADDHASALMTWEEIKRLDPALITIGSHTLTHPMLSSVSDAVAEKEVLDSGKRLGAELNRSIDFFCFPNGDHTPQVLEHVKSYYRAAVGTTHGLNQQGVALASLYRVHGQPKLFDMAWNLFRVTG